MSPQPKVLFVNKGLTSKTLSRSDGAEKSRIFSHVQHPASRDRSQRLLVSSSDSSSSRSSPEESEHGDSEPPIAAFAEIETSPVLTRTRKSPPCCSRKGSKGKADRDEGNLPSPLVALNIAQLDLLGRPAASITNYMNMVMEFYSGTMLDRVFPSKALADASRETTLSYAASDAVVLNAILCTTSGALYMHFRDPKHGYHAMYFKGQAIHHLKQELSGSKKRKIGVSTVYAVSLLLWVECLQGDMEAVEAHIKGLDRMVHLVDDLDQSPLPVLTTILSSAYYCAAMMGTRPVLKPPEAMYNEETSLPTLPELEDDTWGLGTRFFDPQNAAVLGPCLLKLISAQRNFVLFKQLCASDRIAPSYEDLQYIYNSNMNTEYELLDMPFTSGEGAITPRQNAVRLALYIHTQPIITVAKPTAAFSRFMSRQLRDALEQSELSELWSGNCDLLLWVLFVLAQISYEQAEWPWVISYISEIVVALQLISLEDVQAVLKEFYYCPRTFDSTLENVWRDVGYVLES